MTHTKGKWEVSLTRQFVIIKNDNKTITTICNLFEGTEEWESNAERICKMNNSYDELLEACKEAFDYGSSGHLSGQTYTTLENAIAKAEGE